MAITNGQTSNADEHMRAFGSVFQEACQGIFNHDYLGWDSRMYNSGAPNTKNMFFSTFQTDDADVHYGTWYDQANDMYVTPVMTEASFYVIVEATSFNAAAFPNGTNDTYVMPIADGKWMIWANSGTDEEKRAKVHKSLWFDSAALKLILDFTGVTAIKSSDSRDVGKRAYWAYSNMGPNNGSYTGTFTDTTNNLSMSSWSYCYHRGTFIDEFNTDRSADERDNPTTCQIVNSSPSFYRVSWRVNGSELNAKQDGTINSFYYVQAIVLCYGSISWAGSGIAGVNIDYNLTHSIPDMTAADTLANEGAEDVTMIFKSTTPENATNAITTINYTVDSANNVQVSLSADGGSTWVNTNNSDIARFDVVGTSLWRRLQIERNDTTTNDTITEQAVKYNWW